MASPAKIYDFTGVTELTPDHIEQLEEMLRDLYAYLSQSPLGSGDGALDFSALIDPGLLYGDPSSAITALDDTGSVYLDASGQPASLSAATGNVLISGGVGAVPSFGKVTLTTHVVGILPIANGGTNNSSAYTAGSVVFSDGTTLTQDNAGLFFDSANNRLGVGIASPTDALDVRAVSPIIGARFSDTAQFAALRLYEGSTLASSVQHIGSTFTTSARRNNLELLNINAAGKITFHVNASATPDVTIDASGNLSSIHHVAIGTTAYPSSGTFGLIFGDGTALATMGSNTAGLYADDVGGTVRMFGIDEAGVTGALAMAAGTLTSGRVALITTNGLLTDDADLTFATDTLTATKVSTTKVTSTGSANNIAVINKILYGATTDAATAVELTTDGGAGSGATNRIAVPTNAALSVVVNIAVKQSGSANAKQMLRQFLISNNAGTTAIQGSVTTLGTDVGSAGLLTVTTTITANDTDDCIKIEVNGVAVTNLRYTAYVVSAETVYV